MKFYSETELCNVLGVSPGTAARWRRTGDGPPFTKLGVRRIAYPVEGLERWAAERTFPHRAAELAGAQK